MELLIYPQHISWYVDLQKKACASECFSQKTWKKIQKSIDLLQNAGYTFKREDVDTSYIEKFYPLYQDNILHKEHPHVFNIPQDLEKKRTEGIPIEALSLYKENIYLGGVIYRVPHDKIAINYRVFRKEFGIKLPINPSIVADSLLYERAIELGKPQVSHGKDRNLYGLHSNIGLALFKLIAGSKPFVPFLPQDQLFFTRTKNDFSGRSVKTLTFENTKITPNLEQNFYKATHGTLLFLGNNQREPVTKAILFVKEKSEELLTKYELLFNNPHFTTEVVEIGENHS